MGLRDNFGAMTYLTSATLQVAEVSQLYECLCEPWEVVNQFGEPRSGDRDFVTRAALITGDHGRPFGARSSGRRAVTQGSQSLGLGLTLTAAQQLVERSRLTHYHQRQLFCPWVFQVSDLLCEPLLMRGLLTPK